MAIVDVAIGDGFARSTGTEDVGLVQDKLFRECPTRVELLHKRVLSQRASLHDNRSSRQRYRRWRDAVDPDVPKKAGLTIDDVAMLWSLDPHTLRQLLKHHGFMETCSFGGRQRRTLITSTAEAAGYGTNVTPGNCIGHLEGYNKAATFPVLYPEGLPDIRWCLDFDSVIGQVAALSGKKKRLSFLLEEHPYLPDTEIAKMAGYSTNGVAKARARKTTHLHQGVCGSGTDGEGGPLMERK